MYNTVFHWHGPSFMVTDLSDCVVVGHVGGVVAGLVDGQVAVLLRGAVQLKPPLKYQ